MKKYLTAIFVLVVVSFSVQAQKIERFKGVYNIYDFEAECVNAAPPKGFEVFYISHYGRHGSRYIHAEDLYDTLNVILHKFELTAQGEVVRNVFDKYYPDVKGRAGDLSDLGEEQQRLLARRIVKDFPAMFKAGSQVVAYSSDVPRCMMSMYAFLDELRLIRGKLNIDARFDSNTVSQLKAKAPHRFPIAQYVREKFDPREAIARLFVSPEIVMKNTDAAGFIQTLNYYIMHLEGIGLDDSQLNEILTEEEQAALYRIENDKFCYNRGWLCPENVATAIPLLSEIMSSADNQISSGAPMTMLRFGHDNMIMNLMSLLSVHPFDKERFDCEHVMMSSNIRFVFARNKSEEVLVKVQFNESDVMPWRAWGEFRAECMRKMALSYMPLYMAHRGLQPYGPENSLPSFQEAAKRGVWAIETDFRITADGQVVCIHDKKLDRTTNGSGLVADYTLPQLRELRLQAVNAKTVKKQYGLTDFSDEELVIPTMDEYFQICKKSGAKAFIELKEDKGVIDAMMAAIDRHGLHGQCIVSSGKLELLEAYRAKGGSEWIHYIFAKPENLSKVSQMGNASVSFKLADLDNVDMTINGMNITGVNQLVDYIHSMGIKICFRAADNQFSAMKHIQAGVDFIPTNCLYQMISSGPSRYDEGIQ